jgi:hypothetical protein
MPRIELSLPGTQKTRGEPFAETYRITIERDDGIACADIEAQTVMSMFCIDSFKKKARKSPRSTAAKKLDMASKGQIVEMSHEEAESVGGFVEDALSPEDALESSAHLREPK